ncbi:MAG: hypothetical protein ACE5HS_03790 [bacterium]
MNMTIKKLGLNFVFVLLMVLIIPWMFNCGSKKVGPNTPPEIDIENPPEAPGVVEGSVDYAPVNEYTNIIQQAVNSQQVTPEVQSALDTFNVLVGQADVNYLASIDSTELNNIAAELETTGHLPQRLSDILDKLAGWNFLPQVTESSTTDTTGSSKVIWKQLDYLLSTAFGPFEDCVELVDSTYQAQLAIAQQDREDGKAAAVQKETECKDGQNERLGSLISAVDAFCSFAPQTICDLLKATLNISILADLAACKKLRTSTEEAYDDAYNTLVKNLDDWRRAQISSCHETFGG